MRPEIQAWVDRAEYELNAARVMLEAGLHSACVYHCQQAIELGLKARLMMMREADPPRTHSLVWLGNETGALDHFGSFLRELTPAYMDARYPNAGIESPEIVYGGNRSKLLFEQTIEFFKWLRSELART